MCEQLLISEYRRANWETRHGAALGLKEVLRLQGGGGGQLGAYLNATRRVSLLTHPARSRVIARRKRTTTHTVVRRPRHEASLRLRSRPIRRLHLRPGSSFVSRSRFVLTRLPHPRWSLLSARPPPKLSPLSSPSCPPPPSSPFNASSSPWSSKTVRLLLAASTSSTSRRDRRRASEASMCGRSGIRDCWG